MDKRKGLISGYKKLGPISLFLFWLAIIAVVLAIVFFIIQQKTGAIKEGQIEAQKDHDSKHDEEIEQISNITSKFLI